MKRKFHLYCALFILSIVTGVTIDSCMGVYSFMSGFHTGVESSTLGDGKTPYILTVTPKDGHIQYTDSIYNTLTKTMDPVGYKTIYTLSEIDMEHTSMWYLALMAGLVTFCLAIIYFWITFFRLVIDINKEKIFDKGVERKLMTGGITLLVIFLLEWLIDYSLYAINYNNLAFEDYKIEMINIPINSTMYIGFGLMLMAQIFAMGRHLKEENELTI